jgi:hypothetical protein
VVIGDIFLEGSHLTDHKIDSNHEEANDDEESDDQTKEDRRVVQLFFLCTFLSTGCPTIAWGG